MVYRYTKDGEVEIIIIMEDGSREVFINGGIGYDTGYLGSGQDVGNAAGE